MSIKEKLSGCLEGFFGESQPWSCWVDNRVLYRLNTRHTYIYTPIPWKKFNTHIQYFPDVDENVGLLHLDLDLPKKSEPCNVFLKCERGQLKKKISCIKLSYLLENGEGKKRIKTVDKESDEETDEEVAQDVAKEADEGKSN